MSMQLQYRERVRRIKGRRSDSFEEHRRIYQAVSKRKPDEAKAAMARHISQIEKTLRNVESNSKKRNKKSGND